ncbi:uncharacterized protein PV09_01468 [Verruconis gallopava]|uniref:Uncharacterized protein n=1 Tax=Verruconis gallopava TaxID=253628 RepID=A0A0D2AL84_9PEZI|nr:uncharacterized protein PV09_01468 [Verruconis gallopava]KIW07503.1 hypothetical protein PV09_01468 [Verruconis gallopava]
MKVNLLSSNKFWTRGDGPNITFTSARHKSRVMEALFRYRPASASKSPKNVSGSLQESRSAFDAAQSPACIPSVELPCLLTPDAGAIPIQETESDLMQQEWPVPPGHQNGSSSLLSSSPQSRPGMETRPRITVSSESGDEDEAIASPSLIFTATLFPSVPTHGPPPRTSSNEIVDSHGRIQRFLGTKEANDLNIGNSLPDSSKEVRRSSSPGAALVSHSEQQGRQKPDLSIKIPVDAEPPEQEMALTPIEMDLGVLEVIANLPMTARSSGTQAPVELACTPESPGGIDTKSGVAVQLPGASVVPVVAPEQSAWQRAPYVPGAIRLEPKMKVDRSPLAIIQETVQAELGLDKERLAAEEAIMDELVSFIESYGDGFQLGNAEISTYWIDSSSLLPSRLRKGCVSPPLSLAPTLVQSPSPTSPQHLAVDHDVEYRCWAPDYPEFTRNMPRKSAKHTSFASLRHSGSSRTFANAPSAGADGSMTLGENQYGCCGTTTSPRAWPAAPQLEPPKTSTSATAPRKVRQVRGKGLASNGQKMTIRGMLRNAASVV